MLRTGIAVLMCVSAAAGTAWALDDQQAAVLRRATELQAMGQLVSAADLLRGELRGAGDDPVWRGSLLNNLGSVYDHSGDYDRAESNYRQALAEFEQARPVDTPKFLRSFTNLIALYLDYGQVGKAEGLARRLQERVPEWRATGHPDVGRIHYLLGSLLLALGRLEDAERETKAALDVYERTGKDQQDRLSALNCLAVIYAESARPEEARFVAEEVLRTMETQIPVDYPSLARCLVILGAMEARKGDLRRAREHFDRAKEIAEMRLATGDRARLAVLTQCANFFRMTGRKREAKSLEKEVAALTEHDGTSTRYSVDYSSLLPPGGPKK